MSGCLSVRVQAQIGRGKWGLVGRTYDPERKRNTMLEKR